MNVPDPAVYASIPVIGGAMVWSIRALIQEQNRRGDREEAATKTASAKAASDGEEIHLSARDWLNIMQAIEKTFNGRYWQAIEARAAMAELRRHLEEQTEKLHDRISKLREELVQNGR